MGYRISTIFHVDVVDFFSRMYLGEVFGPRRLVQLHRGLHHTGLARFLPDIFRLVFEKQRECIETSFRIILPSQEVAETLRGCYGDDVQQKLAVIPWGSWDEGVSREVIEEETLGLRRHYGVRPDETVLLTLSRLSPEKGIDLLLEALRMWEREEPPKDLRLFICGDAAFMQGKKYRQKLLRQARRLKRVRVDFPGHVTGARKGAFFALAHLYVFPSRHESYGLTLVEALRAGLPVLSSNHLRRARDPEAGVRRDRESERPRGRLPAFGGLEANGGGSGVASSDGPTRPTGRQGPRLPHGPKNPLIRAITEKRFVIEK